MVILDYFVRLPALTAYVAYDKATALYFNWKQLFKVGAYIYTSANLVQVKPLLW